MKDKSSDPAKPQAWNILAVLMASCVAFLFREHDHVLQEDKSPSCTTYISPKLRSSTVYSTSSSLGRDVHTTVRQVWGFLVHKIIEFLFLLFWTSFYATLLTSGWTWVKLLGMYSTDLVMSLAHSLLLSLSVHYSNQIARHNKNTYVNQMLKRGKVKFFSAQFGNTV